MNPFLAKLFFDETDFGEADRVLITHADDFGFCHAANAATAECLASGASSCASVLVNAPWFPEAARLCRENPRFDVGVHLTLTSEYDGLRWSAVSTRDATAGLHDEEGYLWRTVVDALTHVPPEVARAEMRAQLEIALEAGIDVTHIDTHMGTVVHPRYLLDYLDLAREFEVPAFLPRPDLERLEAQPQSRSFAAEYVAALEGVSDADVPMLDSIVIDTLLPLDQCGGNKRDFFETAIRGIEPGLTHLLFHPAEASAELEAATGTWETRNADFEVFSDPAMRAFIEGEGIHLIGYRELRDALRSV